MKTSIQTKLIIMCVLLVLLATVSISIAYYTLTKQDTHRESQQRIQIAFDIIFDDIAEQREFYTQKFEELLQRDDSLALAVQIASRQAAGQTNMRDMIISQLRKIGYVTSANRLALYGADQRLVVEYYPSISQETAKIDWAGETENASTFPLAGDISETIVSTLFSDGQQLGIRIIAPLSQGKALIGVLVGDALFTQGMVERYAALSKTAINFFAGAQYSLGTLPEQSKIAQDRDMVECEDISETMQAGGVFSTAFGGQDYYQGKCSLDDTKSAIGAISVSLSQEIEKQEVGKMLRTVLLISGIVVGVAFGLAVLFSRKTIHSLHDIVTVIGAAAEGDLRKTATPMTRDEIGMLANKLNQMIAQLQSISGQVQGAAYTVNRTADTILQQMDSLVSHMEQQSSSVDNTTNSMETIDEFIHAVSQNTSDLLSASSQILASIQETRASIAEVTISTGTMTSNLQNIFSSVEQVNHTVKHVSEHTGHLENVAQCTETEIQHIDRSLQDVSHNADRAQQLAEETMQAATDGQHSVDASLEGMSELKDVVAHTARIIREVSSWGERVSAILDIVDEITEQTSLLALNASIISAQAGTHGRGFAVVADEIKELATRTKASTQEIGMLVHELQVKTEEGVQNTAVGLKKADLGMQLVRAVKDSLNIILESATRSSNGAAETAQFIQQTAGSSQTISAQITSMSEMASKIKAALQEGDRDIEQIVVSVETISGMSEQVNRANLEQRRAAEEIERSMLDVTEKFSDISEQTETLQQNANQIVSAMHTIESTTGQILDNTSEISGSTVRNLVEQSEVLQKIVRIFKVS